jgi:hypothetical protein
VKFIDSKYKTFILTPQLLALILLFLAKEPQKGIDERNKVKRSQFLTQKEFQSLGGYAKSLVNL